MSDGANLVVELVSILAWPAAVLVIAVIIKRSISKGRP